MFKNTTCDKGLSPKNTSLTFDFHYENIIVKEVKPDCGCTAAKIDNKNNVIKLVYTTPRDVSPHLMNMNITKQDYSKSAIVKFIFINDIDKKEQVISITLKGYIEKNK